MRDAIELEWAGIPTATIVHRAVRGSAEAMARLSGMPDYPLIIVDHPWIPTAIWSEQESLELARRIAPEVRARLVG